MSTYRESVKRARAEGTMCPCCAQTPCVTVTEARLGEARRELVETARAAAVGADLLARESAERPTIWSDRADIYWCVACSHFHRDDYEHEWGVVR